MMAQNIQFADIAWAGNKLVWKQQSSDWGTLVCQQYGQATTVLNTKVSAQGTVGYGGGSFGVTDDRVFFCGKDGRLYSIVIEEGFERAITPKYGGIAAPTPSPNGDWVVYIHSYEDKDCIAIVDSKGSNWPIKLISGADFYMQPTWSPDGKTVAWVSWDHPDMPWDKTRIEMAAVHFNGGFPQLGPVSVLVGGEFSVQQPVFSPSGKYLAYLSDEQGFLQLYVHNFDTGEIQQMDSSESDFGDPAWTQGVRNYVWHTEKDELFAVQRMEGAHSIFHYKLDGSKSQILNDVDYTVLAQPTMSKEGHLAMIASSSLIPSRVVSFEGGQELVRSHSIPERLKPEEFSSGQPISWLDPKTGTRIFGIYYAPKNESYFSDGLPPIVISVHGGPTSQSDTRFNIKAQFFAQRGFGVLELNYRGSTGYGREYMRSLRGNWGEYDVEDAVSAAQNLVDKGLAHPDKIAIMGGSAGGYTVLQALTDCPGVFNAGVCLFGVSNLFTLDQGTHKFESEYLTGLLGPLPESSDKWRERSPLRKVHQIEDPLIIFHGAEDKVVPIDQADQIVEMLKEQSKDIVYHTYPNEGHGWRHPDNIEHYYKNTLGFLIERIVLN
jgi:dipeptidyl aminopeptidase/acylaminoacyl peptidase